jgi:prephenate dehydrogenase
MTERVFDTVAIVGPGLIGGSMGMAMRNEGLATHVVGIGHRQASIEKAVQVGAIDRGTLSLEEGVVGADLVVFCAGVGSIPQHAARAIPHMKGGAVLSDVGSTKVEITRKIEEALSGRNLAFLATHPLAGNERRGVEAARGDLFRGSVCIFTPTPHTTSDARDRMTRLWQSLGARICEMKPTEHDRIVGDISHLPHLIAAIAVNCAANDSLPFAASGFRDTTRVASGDPHLWAEILLSNRENMVRALDCTLAQVDQFATAIGRGNKEDLVQLLSKAKATRDRLFGGSSAGNA